jgi:uncharacterized protein YjbJ (UPF0337 family)
MALRHFVQADISKTTETRGIQMNKQQIKGAAKEAAGKAQKKVGKATANGTMQVKGAAKELAGKAEKSFGNAKAAVKSGMKGDKGDTRTASERSRDRDIERRAH